MQQRRAQRLGVEPHPGADLRDSDRVGDEVLAGLAPLVGMVDARVDERLLDATAVDRGRSVIGVLLDDREQVTEQFLLKRRQVGARDQRVGRRIADAVDPLTRARQGGRGCRRNRVGVALRSHGIHGLQPDRRVQSPGSAAWRWVCSAQVSPSILVSLGERPERRRAVERRRRPARDRQGPQIPVEADELQLR